MLSFPAGCGMIVSSNNLCFGPSLRQDADGLSGKREQNEKDRIWVFDNHDVSVIGSLQYEQRPPHNGL